MSHTSLVTRLRQVAYLAALGTVMLTAKVMMEGEFDTLPGGALAVSIMGGTLAAAPYVISRVVEEHLVGRTRPHDPGPSSPAAGARPRWRCPRAADV